MHNKSKLLFIVIFIGSQAYAQTYTPIGTVNPNDYEPRQKLISEGNQSMVSTQHFLATQVGVDILEKGGNAYDASVAIGFALAVVLPRAGNIGGGGFMVMYDSSDNNNYSIDYREKAPLLSTTNMYLDENGTVIDNKSTLGYLASGVPGTVAGLWSVHQRFGSMKWSELIEPAIKLAEDGFEITPYMADMLIKYNEKLSAFDETNKVFQTHYPDFDKKILKQSDLANTLKIIAQDGRDGFYKGEISKKIALDMQNNGGIISEKDLEQYQPVWRNPLISS